MIFILYFSILLGENDVFGWVYNEDETNSNKKGHINIVVIIMIRKLHVFRVE